MKKMFTTAFFCIGAIVVSAQFAAKSVYAEIGGPGLTSINFDTRFAPKEDGLGFRIGAGGFSVEGESMLFVPVGINYLLGKDKRNYFEIGGGITLASGHSYSDVFSTTFGHLNMGYRLQPLNGGFLFRAAIVPIFNSESFVPYYAGISFGYKF